jgi:hypothetical protein
LIRGAEHARKFSDLENALLSSLMIGFGPNDELIANGCDLCMAALFCSLATGEESIGLLVNGGSLTD